jgi:hypothetical protein
LSADRTEHVNQPKPDAEVEGIARELEQYVSLHPTAADTPDGIARWWLDRAEQPALSRVEAALEVLVARHVLARESLPDGRAVYSARHAPRGRSQ